MSRNEVIDSILEQLGALEAENTDTRCAYAIRENRAFLKAARSWPGYLRWLVMVAPKLDGSHLLELTDFPVAEWDVAMHERLMELQKRKWPGLVAPLVSAIAEYVQKESRDLVILDLGAGGMEVDKQVTGWGSPPRHRLTIVAVDKSPTTRRIARKNLEELADGIEIIETGELTANELERMRKNATKNILVVMCANDIFALDQKFQPRYFDLVYHSLFRHHLNSVEQEQLDRVIPAIGKQHFEFDGYRSWPVVVPQTVVGWNHPHFLNAELFSNLRFARKHDILARAHAQGEVSFYGATGFYLLRYGYNGPGPQ